MNQTVRAASDADGVVNEMRLLVQTGQPVSEVGDLERLGLLFSAGRAASVAN